MTMLIYSGGYGNGADIGYCEDDDDDNDDIEDDDNSDSYGNDDGSLQVIMIII